MTSKIYFPSAERIYKINILFSEKDRAIFDLGTPKLQAVEFFVTQYPDALEQKFRHNKILNTCI